MLIAHLGGRTPLGGERRTGVQQLYVNRPVRHRHEVGNAAVAVHHQAQGRGLHPADRQYALVAGLAPEQGEQAAHVHADQPVRPRATQRRVIQAEGVGARLECAQGLANRGVVQRRQPQALDRPAITTMLHQLTGDHLAFTVGVGGDHQLLSFAQQPLDRLELAGGLGLDLHLPLLGNDRQVFQHPALIACVVGIRRGGLEQVADAPGDRDPASQPATVTTPAGAEHGGNVFGLGRFFTQKQPHNHHQSSGLKGAQHARYGGMDQSLSVWMYSKRRCGGLPRTPRPADDEIVIGQSSSRYLALATIPLGGFGAPGPAYNKTQAWERFPFCRTFRSNR
ncbi:hypothetical protein D3C85_446170 [compost metagenome]